MLWTRSSLVSVHCSSGPRRPAAHRLCSSSCSRPISSWCGAATAGRTVIAGYHWFNDWGRDTMIALPGLTLATGRAEEAADILRTFARYVDQGMLPEQLPRPAPAQVPGYNTVDATLWYVLAIRAYVAATGDARPRRRAPAGACATSSTGTCAARATASRSIRPMACCAPASPGCSSRGWMRRSATGWSRRASASRSRSRRSGTTRCARSPAGWHDRGDSRADAYGALAEQTRASFLSRFWRPELGYLADVVDGPDGDELQLRPNQIFALSLPHPLIEGDTAERVVDRSRPRTAHAVRPALACARRSGVSRRLRRRSASAATAAITRVPSGPGSLAPYVEAHYRVHDDRAAALELLRPFAHHLRDACLGSVSEILEGDAPHLPRGASRRRGAWPKCCACCACCAA